MRVFGDVADIPAKGAICVLKEGEQYFNDEHENNNEEEISRAQLFHVPAPRTAPSHLAAPHRDIH
jgi:hypothetical protein